MPFNTWARDRLEVGVSIVEARPTLDEGVRVAWTCHKAVTLVGSRAFVLDRADNALYVWSLTGFLLGAVGKADWHDDGAHCPTWTGACSCDSEGVNRRELGFVGR